MSSKNNKENLEAASTSSLNPSAPEETESSQSLKVTKPKIVYGQRRGNNQTQMKKPIVPPSAEEKSSTLEVLKPSKVYGQQPQKTSQEQENEQSDSDWSDINSSEIDLSEFDSSDSNSSDTDLSASDCDELDEEALQEKIKQYQNQLKTVTKLKTKVKRQANSDDFKFRSETARMLATMQIRNLKRPDELKTRKDKVKNKRSEMFAMMQMKQDLTQWNALEKNFCMKLYKVDPRGYKGCFDMGMVVAPLPMVRRWLQSAKRSGTST